MKTTPSPYTVVVDTREQSPYTFARPIKLTRGHFRQLTSTRGTLRSGDYSLAGFETSVAIERKSLADLYGTLGRGRARFERELTRLQSFEFSGIVIEAELSTALGSPPAHSRLSPASVLQTWLSWTFRYPATRWFWTPGRDVAEGVTAWLLERFWRKTQEADRDPRLDAAPR